MNVTKTARTVALLIAGFWFVICVQAQDPFTNGLVAYYPFNGNANDASGHANNGTVNGAALATDRFGNANSAYSFDGISSLIAVPDSPALRISNDITVSCWVNFSQTNKGVKLVGKGGDCGRNYGLWLDQGNAWMFQQFPPEGGCVGCQENTASATPAVQLGRWYQLVGVRSGNVSRLYLDGILLQERSPTCSSNTYTGTEPLLIGSFDNPVTDPRYSVMQGRLDDIRIYNRDLSPGEIQQLYVLESGPRVALIKAVKPLFYNLSLTTNYQLQVSTDLTHWTNQSSAFTAININMTYPQYFDVDNWDKLFFRLQVAP